MMKALHSSIANQGVRPHSQQLQSCFKVEIKMKLAYGEISLENSASAG